MQQPPRPGMNGQASGQPGTVSVDMSVNSSMPSVVHNQGQNTSVQGAESAMPMPPNVQVGDMRPPAAQMPAQKSVATVAPRVVLSSNAVTTRPVQPITMQILQSLQASQQVHFLLKTVNGQYQLLTVRPASGMNSLVHPVHTQGIRRSSVPALAGGVATVATNTLISIGHQLQHMQQQHLQQQQLQQQQLQQQRQQQLQQQRQQQLQQHRQQQLQQQQREQQQREQQKREQQQREQQKREQQKREQQKREQQKREQQKREQQQREQQQREQQQREQQQREQQQREQQQREQQKREEEQREQQKREQQQMQQLQQQQMQQQQTQQQQMQQPKMPQPMSITVASVSIAIEQPVHRTSQVTKSVTAGDVTKEKCRIFLSNLLDLARKEPRNMEWDVRCLIQELIDDRVGPKQFCIRLERMLSAIPQPCLAGFLKKSLPLVRKAMLLQELAIEGINPPPYRVAFPLPQPMGNLEIMPMAPPPGAVPVSDALMVTPPEPVLRPGGLTALLNIPKVTQVKLERPTVVSVNKSVPRSSTSIANASGKSVHKDKERNVFPSSVTDDKMAGDDDINDVAAMGGVNLQEETQRILGNTDLIGSQIRSCKEDYLVPPQALMARIKARCAARGLEEPSAEVAQLFAHALNERMKSLIEKLICSSQNRMETDCKTDKRYEVTQDVRGQLKFLEELDHVEKKRQEESEREMLLRAAKSRSKNEDPEQAKLKAKAKEMQRVELEELRQREANLTALQAIGARKKPRLESTAPASAVPQGSRGQMAMRPRTKRITLRDMLHMLESDRHYCRSVILYKAYLKS